MTTYQPGTVKEPSRQSRSAYKLLSEAWTLKHSEREITSRQSEDNSIRTTLLEYWQNTLKLRRPQRLPLQGSFTKYLVKKIFQNLKQSSDIESDLEIILNSSNPHAIASLLFSGGSFPYVASRFYRKLLRRRKVPNIELLASGPRTIDEAIIENENFLRSSIENHDSMQLITISDLKMIIEMLQNSCEIAKHVPHFYDEEDQREGDTFFERSPLPTTELTMLDSFRDSRVSFRRSDYSFSRAFDWATGGILEGLNWSNILVVGDAVSAIFLHPSCSLKSRSLQNITPGRLGKHPFARLELRLYGLHPSEANEKLRHIESVWKGNLRHDYDAPVIVFGPEAITFSLKSPEKVQSQVQISLTLRKSKTEVLLDMVHDVSAIAFDGNEVVMLPRCARAIETGCAVVTSRLVLASRVFNGLRRNQDRILTKAYWGFGLRILPIYSQILEDDSLDQMKLSSAHLSDTRTDEPLATATQLSPQESFNSVQMSRKCDVREQGLKTLHRITFLSQDRVHRMLELLVLNADSSTTQIPGKGEQPKFVTVQRKQEIRNEMKILGSDLTSLEVAHPFLELLHSKLLIGDSLPSMEAFQARCECQRILLESLCGERLDRGIANTVPWLDEIQPCDDTEISAFDIMMMNRVPFEGLIQDTVRLRTGMLDVSTENYIRYLTGRIYRRRHHTDIDNLLQARGYLQIPLLINRTAENLLKSYLPGGMLTKVYNRNAHSGSNPQYTGVLPALEDSDDSIGNLRYLKLGGVNMWRGVDRDLDKAIETLMFLAEFSTNFTPQSSDWFDRSHIKESFLEELLNQPASMFPQIEESVKWENTVIPLREALTFRAWVMAGHSRYLFNDFGQDLEPEILRNKRNDLVPDELYWTPIPPGSEEQAGV